MSLVVLGLNQRNVPLDLLERASLPGDRVRKALHDLCTRPYVNEAVVIATCNRTEVYVAADRFHGAHADVLGFFADLTGLEPALATEHLFSAFDGEAVAHLFRVVSGLDSAVVGESEILGQVRDAWETARAEGSSQSSLNLVFRHALEVGKRVRTDTGIGRGTASVSHAAVELAADHLGSLKDRRVLVVGAGEMGEGMAVALASADGVREVIVANRTLANGERLAERVGGWAVRLSEAPQLLAEVDVVLAGADGGMVVERAQVEAALPARGDRPLLLIDIAVPRNVEPSIGELDGVTVLDLDDLRAWAAKGVARRATEVRAAEDIVDEELARFADVAQARQVAPLIGQLRERAETLRQAELTRARRKLGELTPEQAEAVDALTRQLVAKLLHEPSVRLKADAGTSRGERNAAAVRDLFDLD